MKSVAFGFQRGRIRVAVAAANPAIHLVKSFKMDIDDTLALPELMHRYKRDIDGILADETPGIVAVKLVFDTNTIAGAKGSSLPSAILALECHSLGIPLAEYTSASFRHPGPFNLPANSKPIDEVDRLFGQHPPYWDKLQREIVLAAWRALL